MSVYFVVPSARPVAECKPVFEAWRDMGYYTLIQRDHGAECGELWDVAEIIQRPYRGYVESVNALAKAALASDPGCDWIVTGGDDTYPDPNKRAEEIAAECSEHFRGSFGIMQPTGDPWADSQGRIIERLAGSAWMGREWCRRAYQGRGPQCPEYHTYFADIELQCVAQRLGVFWQRHDLTHMHQNWARPKSEGDHPTRQRIPEFLAEVNSPEYWGRWKPIFDRRQREGFPGSDPL